MERLRRVPRRDEGVTLVEVLVAVVILSFAGAAVMAGVGMSVKASDLNRRQTDGGAQVRNWAEAIQRYVAADHDHYVACPGADDDDYAPEVVGFVLPARYVATYEAPVRLDGTGTAITGACSVTDPMSDQGLQRLKLKVTSGSGDKAVEENLTIVIRQSCPGVTGADACLS